jgi:hypothetical protein
MRIFQLTRRPPQWLRVVLAGLLLAFALNSIAHAAHVHEIKATPATHVVCGYCATFSGGAHDAPVYAHSLPLPTLTSIEAAYPLELFVARRPASSAQPRAPPIR